MKINLLILILTICSIAASDTANALTPDIIGPEMEIRDNNIIISLSIKDVRELESTIKSGIGKEIVFTVELLRTWLLWPDEFVVSKKIEKLIKYDNLREQYEASSYDGILRENKSFYSYSEMQNWLYSTNNVDLANVKELEPGSYYIRVIVESKSMEQLPLIGYLMHLIPEVEMSLAKESQPFIVEGNK